MKSGTKNKINKIHKIFHICLLLFSLVWIISDIAIQNVKNVQIAPLYKDAIKAVDPMEYFRDDLGAKDFAGY